MGNTFGCSVSGERLVTAACDGDWREAQALLNCNPSLVNYSTFGVRNSSLHFSAVQGHNEVVTLLLEYGVEVNSQNYCGQTALMQACCYGHWEVVQTLLLYRADILLTWRMSDFVRYILGSYPNGIQYGLEISRADNLNGRTALHFAAVSGHARCIRLVLADFVPIVPQLWSTLQPKNSDESTCTKNYPEQSLLARAVNCAADGGITSLHLAALNSHVECVQLLLDFSANVNAVTIQDGTSIDLIGAGSTPLHYAAYGGSITCCQALIANGANRNATNYNGWTASQVARMWRRHWLEPLLLPDSSVPIEPFPPSRYLALPLSSIVEIARDCGWRNVDLRPSNADPCSVCLERRCTVAAKGCEHQLCTRCALYLCSTNIVPSRALNPPGAIPCPLCRRAIVSFVKLPSVMSLKGLIE